MNAETSRLEPPRIIPACWRQLITLLDIIIRERVTSTVIASNRRDVEFLASTPRIGSAWFLPP